MSRLSTATMWTAVILLAGAYFFPLWQIRLHAPQYPQGLGIDIWVDKITGAAPHDLQNINGLNHYIGMAAITPEAIPELRLMKWVLAGLVALGVVVALLRRRALLVAWVVVAVALSAVGMFDFYQWEYRYGHDLDPSAAIKIPGMSYQPPMFGTKQLLNFTTTAWPGLGGLFAMVAVGSAALACIAEFVRRRRRGAVRMTAGAPSVGGARVRVAILLAFTALPALASSCSRGPQPIEYGSDACDYCMMTISDDRYGAEIVTDKGRVLKYDAIECMASALLEGDKIDEAGARLLFAADYANRRTLVRAESATYLHSASLPSPMGMNLTSFARKGDAEGVRAKHEGALLDWQGVVSLVGDRSGTGHGHDGSI